MVRRANRRERGPKANRTNLHIKDPRFENPKSSSWSPGDQRRQSLFLTEFNYSIEQVASALFREAAKGIYFFPDANIAINPNCRPLWDALTKAGSLSKSPTCGLTTPVHAELDEWLNAPKRNHLLAKTIQQGLIAAPQSWIQPLGLCNFDPMTQATFAYYIQLLGLRRKLALPTESPAAIVGNPRDKQQMMNSLKDQLGLRAQLIAKKGLVDWERKGQISLNDESHVATAFAFVIRNGVASMILTMDYDVYEIFYKLQYLLDTHYRAWRVAPMLKMGMYGESWDLPHNEAGSRWPFDGDGKGFRQLTPDFGEALPEDYASAPLSILYLGPEGAAYQATVFLVRDLNGLIWTKALSRGRNTLQFGDHNVHIDPSLIGEGFVRTIAVALDRTFPIGFRGMEISHLDAIMSVNCAERHSAHPLPSDDGLSNSRRP